ncbi:hypothetical protein SeMB42_g00868 [Synchytrium endobioticum]|uniref:Uncharacterized protein n=1 Tax=Synchytrium endobioticum TaxID=286115 RepID=A0A507DQW0_9FUNG|nr:hypothetical protein SeMB42_g00868 [Synchytrium endobioticum]
MSWLHKFSICIIFVAYLMPPIFADILERTITISLDYEREQLARVCGHVRRSILTLGMIGGFSKNATFPIEHIGGGSEKDLSYVRARYEIVNKARPGNNYVQAIASRSIKRNSYITVVDTGTSSFDPADIHDAGDDDPSRHEKHPRRSSGAYEDSTIVRADNRQGDESTRAHHMPQHSYTAPGVGSSYASRSASGTITVTSQPPGVNTNKVGASRRAGGPIRVTKFADLVSRIP